MPTFTVICPTWNRGEALRATVDSVLGQTFPDLELWIASDGSTDDTDRVALEYAAADPRVRFIRTRRYGYQAGPTNEALRESDGDLVAYIDHDDRWAPRHLEVLLRLFADGAGLAASRATKVDPEGRRARLMHPVSLLWHPQAQVLNPLFENSCAAHTRELGELVGGWRESEVGLEDWDLWLRLTDAGGRAATTLESTVEIVELPDSREKTLPVRHMHRLAHFDDARSARAAVRRLTDQRHYELAAQACLDDLTDWYARLAEEGSLVFPRGWAHPGSVPRDVVADHIAEAGRRWIPPVVERTDDGWTVGIPIAVMTREHALRYEAVFRTQMPRQREFLAQTLGGVEPELEVPVGAHPGAWPEYSA